MFTKFKKRSKLFGEILKSVGAYKFTTTYVAFFFIASLITMIFEPEVNTYGDALWYCFNVATTIGLGDIVISTFIGRLLSILLSLYSIFMIALVPTILINYHREKNAIKNNESIILIKKQLLNLENLSQDELKDISIKLKDILD